MCSLPILPILLATEAGSDVMRFCCTGVGELSVWDFSGYEPYLMLYDHFIGDPNCIHLIAFSLTEPPNVQLSQVMFWLHFIKARIPAFEPIGRCSVCMPGGVHSDFY